MSLHAEPSQPPLCTDFDSSLQHRKQSLKSSGNKTQMALTCLWVSDLGPPTLTAASPHIFIYETWLVTGSLAHSLQWEFHKTINKNHWNLSHLPEGTGQVWPSTHWMCLSEPHKTAGFYSFLQGTPNSSLSSSDHSLHPLLRKEEDTG